MTKPGPYREDPVTKSEYLWAAAAHKRACLSCRVGVLCNEGKIFKEELDRMGWKLEEAPSKQSKRPARVTG